MPRATLSALALLFLWALAHGTAAAAGPAPPARTGSEWMGAAGGDEPLPYVGIAATNKRFASVPVGAGFTPARATDEQRGVPAGGEEPLPYVRLAAATGPARPAAVEARQHIAPPLTASPTVHGLERAQRRADGTVVVTAPLTGTGAIHAAHVVVEGLLSPGNSPGCISFGGNVTFAATATVLIEIGGTVPCTDYDQIHVANTLTLDGATLEVVLIDGFVPQWGDHFDVLDWGTLAGSFATIDTSAATLPAPLVWDTSQLYVAGELIVDVEHYADGDLAPWNAPDAQINAADVMIAVQLVAGQRTPGPLQYAHGDMNLDDTIDLADVLLIQQAVAP